MDSEAGSLAEKDGIVRVLDRRQIEALRGEKHALDVNIPYHFLHEKERDPKGVPRSVNTLFLTNQECPFRCVFCDLWKHTLDQTTPAGAIPNQIRYALERLPEAEWVKLYNNGNFFDPRAIPESDYPAIATEVSTCQRVIVENHPNFAGPAMERFRDLLNGRLEIAIGVETIHPEVLKKLNKGCDRAAMERAASLIRAMGADLRAFILLNPPYLTDSNEIRYWCLESARFAFEAGFQTVTIIPVRPGNGAMEYLLQHGFAVKADLYLLEEVASEARSWNKGRVFVDMWDIDRFLREVPEQDHARLKRSLEGLTV